MNCRGINVPQLDYLDQVAALVMGGDLDAFGPLSTGERLYVAVAANQAQLLAEDGYTIAQALARLGPEWTAELVQRWQYGTPEHARAKALKP